VGPLKEKAMKNFLLFFAVVLLVLIVGCSCNSSPEPICKTAILGAFADETALLEQQLSIRKEYHFEGISFFTGKLNNRLVVLTNTGIGKVNAAMTTTLVITKFEPDEVIFTGIAGAINPELRPGDIVIAEKIAQHDYGLTTDAGFETQATTNQAGVPNPLFFAADKQLLDEAIEASRKISLNRIETAEGLLQPKIITGVVVTGDSFIASEKFGKRLRRSLGADAVEMEGAAVAQVCYQQNIPCIVIRSISDKANETAVVDVERFMAVAAGNSAKLVAEMVRQLGESNRDN
jgi:adenosylhomocysteine nucleosidase